jgi:hypothetical protein
MSSSSPGGLYRLASQKYELEIYEDASWFPGEVAKPFSDHVNLNVPKGEIYRKY